MRAALLDILFFKPLVKRKNMRGNGFKARGNGVKGRGNDLKLDRNGLNLDRDGVRLDRRLDLLRDASMVYFRTPIPG